MFESFVSLGNCESSTAPASVLNLPDTIFAVFFFALAH
uniref:Uncharacterized protein n=1 Tax=Anguilla anguilla TaxID=7936 RepID=A0A0E9R8B8_ANGAN